MWIRSTSELSSTTKLVTTEVSSHLLVAGDKIAIVNSSISPFANRLVTEIQSCLEEGEELEALYILLTDAAFDNTGGILELKKTFPNTIVVGTQGIAEKLRKPTYGRACRTFNKEATEALGMKFKGTIKDWTNLVKVDLVIEEGEDINLDSDVSLKAILCSGFREETTGYLSKPDLNFSSGEAIGGYHGRDKYTPAFQNSYTDYLGSLEKIAELEIKSLILAHGGAITGNLVKKFIQDSLQETQRIYQLIKNELSEGKLAEEVSETIESEWEVMGGYPTGPFKSQKLELIEGMVKSCL